MFALPNLGIRIVNDINKVNENEIFGKIQTNTYFSFSFIALLIGSTIVCTLGLLLNAPPIVIGGMIISPLMWPLVKISLGISYENTRYIRQAVILLVFCIFVALVSSSVITYISPVKLINTEILARTSPTLLDLIIALVAGGIAALAITQPRISESLAGVAIATSLMPPLCVSGIGLALLNMSIFTGGFLLFFSNIVSIVFVSTLTFIFVGAKRYSESRLRIKGVLIIAAVLFFTAIPLSFFLKNYSFKMVAYNKVQDVLRKTFKDISPSVFIESVKTSTSAKGGNVLVDAQVWLPEDLTIDYKEQQEIVKSLEDALGKKVDLNLRLQRTISIVSKEDRLNEFFKKQLQNIFLEEIEKINSSFSVDTLEINFDEESENFDIQVVLRGDPTINMTQKQREELEEVLNQKIGKKVSLNIEIISRIKLQSSPEIENQQIKQELQKLLHSMFGDVDISSISLKTQEKDTKTPDEEKEEETIIVDMELKVPENFEMSVDAVNFIKAKLGGSFNKKFEFVVKTIEKKSYFF